MSDPDNGIDPNDPANWHVDHGKVLTDFSDFEAIKENIYAYRKVVEQTHDQVEVCVCRASEGGQCLEDCLNRLLFVECDPRRCPLKRECRNNDFQMHRFKRLDVVQTKLKGRGLRSPSDISAGEFIIEYQGEVLDPVHFKKRAREFAKRGKEHFYFMGLDNDEIVDASEKGNISRFINHSCRPNCETQKWSVLGELRIGLFARTDIPAGTELTFDYKYVDYGNKSQPCYCGETNCRSTIGGGKMNLKKTRSDDDEDDYEENEVSRLLKNKGKRKKKGSIAEDHFAWKMRSLQGSEGGILPRPNAARVFLRLIMSATAVHSKLLSCKVVMSTRNEKIKKDLVEQDLLMIFAAWLNDDSMMGSEQYCDLFVALFDIFVAVPARYGLVKKARVEDAVQQFTDHHEQRVANGALAVMEKWRRLAEKAKSTTSIPKRPAPVSARSQDDTEHKRESNGTRGSSQERGKRDRRSQDKESRRDRGRGDRDRDRRDRDRDRGGDRDRDRDRDRGDHEREGRQDKYRFGKSSIQREKERQEKIAATRNELIPLDLEHIRRAEEEAKEQQDILERQRAQELLPPVPLESQAECPNLPKFKALSAGMSSDASERVAKRMQEYEEAARKKLEEANKEQKRRKRASSASGNARPAKRQKSDDKEVGQLLPLAIFQDNIREMVVGFCSKHNDQVASKEDFKLLAKKLTRTLLEKEIRASSDGNADRETMMLRLSSDTRKKVRKYIEHFFDKLDAPYVHPRRSSGHG